MHGVSNFPDCTRYRENFFDYIAAWVNPFLMVTQFGLVTCFTPGAFTHQRSSYVEALYKCLWRSAHEDHQIVSPVHGRRSKFGLTLFVALALGSVSTTPSADARIIRLEILSVQSPTFGGLSFGSVGTYEKIFARAYGEVDPFDRRNSLITDINLAPRNASGMVEYSADVHIIKPTDMSRGNQRIFYDVVNRGNKGHGAL